MPSYTILPHANAMLNGTSAVLLLCGYFCIRRGLRMAHRRFMLAALASSALFLASYVAYHLQAGSVRFQGTGWIRLLYFFILLSHTVLAIVVLPLVLVTVSRALRGSFDRHRKIARWTFPVWLYVSFTGVFVYILLYHVSAAR